MEKSRVWRPRVTLAMDGGTRARLLTPALAARLAAVADVAPGPPAADFTDLDAVKGTEILLTGWGAPRVDSRALEAMPDLRAVTHAAGSVKPFVAPEVFERGVLVTSAAEVNAIPVAEFTFAAVVLAANRVPALVRDYRRTRDYGVRDRAGGTNGITVGVVGASRVGRRVLGLLRALDATLLIADPYLSDPGARALGASRVPLDDLMSRSGIVTLHAPELPATRHMIGARQLRAMKDGAVLINTARGSLVDETALIAELRTGRIEAVLDVTDPEPPPPDSPLWALPNLTLTPHIAGATGSEVARLMESAIAEIEALAAGRPPRHPVTLADLERMA